MDKFDTFVDKQQKGKLHIEGDGEGDEKWLMEIDIIREWTDMLNNTISIIDFNNQYATKLMENQQNISKICGDFAWNEIEPVVVDELRKATNFEASESVYNKLYDIFDKYEIFIKTA